MNLQDAFLTLILLSSISAEYTLDPCPDSVVDNTTMSPSSLCLSGIIVAKLFLLLDNSGQQEEKATFLIDTKRQSERHRRDGRMVMAAVLVADLRPAATYNLSIAPVTPGGNISTIHSENTFSTVPSIPEVVSVVQQLVDPANGSPEMIEVKISDDPSTADIANLVYELTFLKDDGTKIFSQLANAISLDSTAVLVNTTRFNEKLVGSCRYNVKAVSLYKRASMKWPLKTQPSSLRRFTTQSRPVTKTNAKLHDQGATFKNPHTIDLEWFDDTNCQGDTGYAVILKQQSSTPQQKSRHLLDKFTGSTTFSAQFTIDLTPATTYSVAIGAFPLSGDSVNLDNQQPGIVDSGPFSTAPIQPEILDVIQSTESGKSEMIQIKLSDPVNVDKANLYYEIEFFKSDGSGLSIFNFSVRASTQGSATVANFNTTLAFNKHVGACHFSVKVQSFYNRTVLSQPLKSLQTNFRPFKMRPVPVAQVTANLNNILTTFQNPHSIGIDWVDTSNCYSDGKAGYVAVLKQIDASPPYEQRHQLDKIVSSSTAFNASLGVNLTPATAYSIGIQVVSLSGDPSIRDFHASIPVDSVPFATVPVPPEIVSIVQSSEMIQIEISDALNLDKQNLYYEFAFSKNDASPVLARQTFKAPLSSSNFNMTTLYGKVVGACLFGVKVQTIYNRTSLALRSPQTGFRVFTLQPRPVSKVTGNLVQKPTFENPHNINLQWFDDVNCPNDGNAGYVAILKQIGSAPPYEERNFLDKFTGGPMFNASLVAELTPATTYTIAIQAIHLSSTSSARNSPDLRIFESDPFSTAPVPPEILEVNQASEPDKAEIIEIKLSDPANVDKDNLYYDLAFSKPDGTPMNTYSIRALGTSTIALNTTTLFGKVFGACQFGVRARTIYNRTGSPSLKSQRASIRAFTLRSRPVSNVAGSLVEKPTFHNPHNIDLQWLDESNCYGKGGAGYAVILKQLASNDLDVVHEQRHLLDKITAIGSSMDVSASLAVDLTPATTYKVAIEVVPMSPSYLKEAPPVESNLLPTAPVVPQITDVRQLKEKEIQVDLFDDMNVDKVNLYYQLDIESLTDPSAPPLTSEKIKANELEPATKWAGFVPSSKFGASRYGVRVSSIYKNRNPVVGSLQHKFTTSPEPINQVTVDPLDAEGTVAYENPHKITIKWLDELNGCYNDKETSFHYAAIFTSLSEQDVAGKTVHLLDNVDVDINDDTKFNALLKIDLPPAASYSLGIHVVPLSEASLTSHLRNDGQNVAVGDSHTFSTAPVPPQLTKVSQSNDDMVEVEFFDDFNIDKVNLYYQLIFRGGNGVDIKKSGEIKADQASKLTNWKGTIPFDKSGACRYSVTAISIYKPTVKKVTYNSVQSSPQSFTRRPKAVTYFNASIPESGLIEHVEFKNPHTVNLEWLDYSNCFEGEANVIAYVVILNELEPRKGAVINKQRHILQDAKGGSPRLTASIVIDLTPATAYSVALDAILLSSTDLKETEPEGPTAYIFTAPIAPYLLYDAEAEQMETESSFFVKLLDDFHQVKPKQTDGDFVKLSYVIKRSRVDDFELPTTFKPGDFVALPKAPGNNGACRYATQSFIKMEINNTGDTRGSIKSLVSQKVTTDTSPIPVEDARVVEINDSSLTVIVSFTDKHNCINDGDNPAFSYKVSLYEENGSGMSKFVANRIIEHDEDLISKKDGVMKTDVDLPNSSPPKPACGYFVMVETVSSSSSLFGSKKIALSKKGKIVDIRPKSPTSINLAARPPQNIQVYVNKDENNCMSDNLVYNVKLLRLNDSVTWTKALSPLVPANSTQTDQIGPFAEFSINDERIGGCRYKAIVKSSLKSSQKLESFQETESSVLLTAPLAINSTSIEINAAYDGINPSNIIVRLSWVDKVNCPPAFDTYYGNNESLYYEIVITNTAKRGDQTSIFTQTTTDWFIKFTLPNQRPSTSYQVSISVKSTTGASSPSAVRMFTTAPSSSPTSSQLSTFLVGETPGDFMLAIKDIYNNKFLTCMGADSFFAFECSNSLTFDYLSYLVAIKSYDASGCTADMKAKTTSDVPYVTIKKPSGIGGCYYSVYAKALLNSDDSQNYCDDKSKQSIVLMTDPAEVKFLDIFNYDSVKSTLKLQWRDELNCIKLDDSSLQYDIRVVQVDYYCFDGNCKNGNDQVGSKTARANDVRDPASRQASIILDIADPAPGCSFNAMITTWLKVPQMDKYQLSRTVSKNNVFKTKPLKPIIEVVSEDLTQIVVKVIADKQMTCYSTNQKPSFTAIFGPTSEPSETQKLSVSYSLDGGLSGTVTFKKPKSGACDYQIQAATTSSYGEISETAVIPYETAAVAPKGCSIAAVLPDSIKAGDIIHLDGNSSSVSYQGVTFVVLWEDDDQNCADEEDHISYCVEIFEKETPSKNLVNPSYSCSYNETALDVVKHLDANLLIPGCSYQSRVFVRRMKDGQLVQTSKSVESSSLVFIQPANVKDVRLTQLSSIQNGKANVSITWRDDVNCPSSQNIAYKVTIYACYANGTCQPFTSLPLITRQTLHSKTRSSSSVWLERAPNGEQTQIAMIKSLDGLPQAVKYLTAHVGVGLSGHNECMSSSCSYPLDFTKNVDKLQWPETQPADQSQTWFIATIALCAVLVILILLVIVGFLLYYRSRISHLPKMSESFVSEMEPKKSSVKEAEPPEVMTLSLQPVQRSTLQSISSSEMTVEHFVAYIRQAKDSNYVDLQDSYHLLTPIGRDQSTSDGCSREARAKNRYNDIVPYNHSRVKLIVEPDDNGNVQPAADYINASFIRGVKSKTPSPTSSGRPSNESINGSSKSPSYIATQGPRTNTIPDFWLMCWQQRVDTIVMLTPFVEGGRVKCDTYWPLQPGQHAEYGRFRVENVTSSDNTDDLLDDDDEDIATIASPDVVRRTLLRVSDDKGNETTITHFQHLDWADRGIPEKLQVIGLLKVVARHRQKLLKQKQQTAQKDSHEQGPIVVHCSAGVGRTGVFITLDIALHPWLLADATTDRSTLPRFAPCLFNIVSHLRKARPNMVQTEEQFYFLHDAAAQVLSKFVNVQSSDSENTVRKASLQQQRLLPPDLLSGSSNKSSPEAKTKNVGRSNAIPPRRSPVPPAKITRETTTAKITDPEEADL